ncbi:MAG: hypothetical protein KC800_10870, partial [Candidatus Eremiobacteraeota bacterium]|nr:hypothetical protein [Candidatus Eremiobacteraeota bacterium]
MNRLAKIFLLVLLLLSSPVLADAPPTTDDALKKLNGLQADSGLDWLAPLLSRKTKVLLNEWSGPEQERFAELILPTLRLSQGEKWEAKSDGEQKLVLTAGTRTVELFVEDGRWVTDISEAVSGLEPVIGAAVVLDKFDRTALDAAEVSELYPFLSQASAKALGDDPEKARSLLAQLKVILPGLRDLPLMDLALE